MQFLIETQVEKEGQQSCGHLTHHRGEGGAQHLHTGKEPHTENEQRIQNNIDNGAGGLGNHGIDGFPRGLEQTLQHGLAENGRGTHAEGGEILDAVSIDLGIGAGGLTGEKGLYTGQTDHHKDQRA